MFLSACLPLLQAPLVRTTPLVLYDVIDTMSNRRRAREQGGVIAVSGDDFFCVVSSQSFHCSVFCFPCLMFSSALSV